jgi:hypothetical protein
MKVARRLVISALAVVICLSMSANLARAQAIKQIPANAMVVLKIKSLSATSKKISDFLKALGVADQVPGADDPLAFIQTQGNLQNGLNKDGEFVAAFIDPGEGGSPDKSFMMLFPTSDYDAFIKNFPDAKTDGGISAVTLPNSSDQAYVSKWGDFAALSPNKDLVAKAPSEAISIAGLSAKEMDDKDIVVYANFKQIRAKALPELQKNRPQIMQDLDQNLNGNEKTKKYAPVIKAVVNEALDFAESFLNQADGATLGLNISDEGVNSTLMCEFGSDTYIGKLASSMKNTDAPLLKGLPDGKYLFCAGSVADPEISKKVIEDVLAPISKSLQEVPDSQPMQDYLDAVRAAVSTDTSSVVGVAAPQGTLGVDALVQFISIRTGDAKVMSDANKRLFDDQQSIMKMFGLGDAQMGKTTFTPKAKTVNGVDFDQYQTTIDTAAAQDPNAQKVGMFFTYAYGQDGMKMLSGAVDDKTLVTSSGLPDDQLAAAVAAIKGGDDAVSKNPQFASVAGHLPKERLGAFFLPLGTLMDTGFAYAGKMGMDMGVQIPPDLEPIGMTLSTEGTAFKLDSYVPAKTVATIVDTVKKVAGRQMRGGGGGGL